jgi:hypothetical protein
MNWRIPLFSLLGGLCFSATGFGGGHFWWSLVAGILLTASLTPLVRFTTLSFTPRIAAIALVVIVIGIVCTVSEGIIFYPETKPAMMKALIGGSIAYFVISVVLVGIANLLNFHSDAEHGSEPRPIGITVFMVLLSALSYVVYYMIFGAITFQLYTKQFYPHAAEQVGALGQWFWAYQFGRGLLMTLAILPPIYSLKLPRWKAALAIGLITWIAGGGASLLVPNELMVSQQRYAHIIEIFTQNFSLGVTATLLLRRRGTEHAAQMHAPTTA